MFKPRYPTSDTPTLTAHTPAATPPAAPAPVSAGSGLAARLPRSTGTTIALAAGGVAGVLALASVAVSLLLAVAVTAVALSVSGLVVLFLVRTLRDEINHH